VFDTHLCFDAPLFRFNDLIPMQSIKNAKIPEELFTLFAIEVYISDGEIYRYSTFFSREVAFRCISEILLKVKDKAKSDSLKKSLSEVTAAPEEPASSKTAVVKAVNVKTEGIRAEAVKMVQTSLSSEVTAAPEMPVSSETKVVKAANVKTGVERAVAVKTVKTDNVKRELPARTITCRLNYIPLIVIGALALLAVQDDIFELIVETRRATLHTGAGKASLGKLLHNTYISCIHSLKAYGAREVVFLAYNPQTFLQYMLGLPGQTRTCT